MNPTPDTQTNVDSVSLRRLAPAFERFLATEGVAYREQRAAKDQFFAESFNRDVLQTFDEGRLRELVYHLWSFNGWTNKDYVVEQILQSGLPQIREGFRKLVYGPGTIAERFDYMRGNVRNMGAASISEILAHLNHSQYPIWNARSRQGLIALGVPEGVIPKRQANGTQYEQACHLMRAVRANVAATIPSCTDLFELDLLLYFLSREAETRAPVAKDEPRPEQLDHSETIDLLIELGDGLGFEVQKEVPITAGCRIDVLWRTRVANLGTIGYAFEVHNKGSRDSAILNLQRVRRDPSIQKVVLVTTSAELEIFRREIASLDEGFRQAVGYLELPIAIRALDHLQSLKATLNEIGLLRAVTREPN
ncbi:MAG TPA: hypothetical protein VES88_14980 [Gemmatimonadaceae bacterium]|nr:hypothetical protein [Gemmatimonadaceae bacterium]